MQDPKIVQKRIGEYVRHLRKKRRWSQRVLAEKAGLAKTFAGNIERGEVEICTATVCKLAGAFEIRLAELWDSADDGSQPSGHRVIGASGQRKGKARRARSFKGLRRKARESG